MQTSVTILGFTGVSILATPREWKREVCVILLFSLCLILVVLQSWWNDKTCVPLKKHTCDQEATFFVDRNGTHLRIKVMWVLITAFFVCGAYGYGSGQGSGLFTGSLNISRGCLLLTTTTQEPFEQLGLSCKLSGTCANTSFYSCSSSSQTTGFVPYATVISVQALFSSEQSWLCSNSPAPSDMINVQIQGYAGQTLEGCQARLGELDMSAYVFNGAFQPGGFSYSPRLQTLTWQLGPLSLALAVKSSDCLYCA